MTWRIWLAILWSVLDLPYEYYALVICGIEMYLMFVDDWYLCSHHTVCMADLASSTYDPFK